MTFNLNVHHRVTTDLVPQVALLAAGCWLARSVEGRALRARVATWWRREQAVARDARHVQFEALEVLR